MAVASLDPRPRPDDPLQGLEQALCRVVDALERREIPYLVVGGLASSVYGRPRFTTDIDVLVRPEDALRALEALGGDGFETEETDPHWIYKARWNGIVVDVLFALKGGIYLDDAMLRRSTLSLFRGCAVRVVPPEDLVVTKAIAHDEPSLHHWHDALGVLARRQLDWGYLLERGRTGARRLLSLLVYAQAEDLVVPDWVVRRLTDAVYPPAPAER